MDEISKHLAIFYLKNAIYLWKLNIFGNKFFKWHWLKEDDKKKSYLNLFSSYIVGNYYSQQVGKPV